MPQAGKPDPKSPETSSEAASFWGDTWHPEAFIASTPKGEESGRGLQIKKGFPNKRLTAGLFLEEIAFFMEVVCRFRA